MSDRSLRVLIADDDVLLTMTLQDIFESVGWKVVTVESGEEAVRVAEQEEIDVVLLDLRMRGSNGVAALLEIRRLRPGVRACVTSGYPIEHIVDEVRRNDCWHVIRRMDDLATLARSSLEARRSVLVLDGGAAPVEEIDAALAGAGIAAKRLPSLADALARLSEVGEPAVLRVRSAPDELHPRDFVSVLLDAIPGLTLTFPRPAAAAGGGEGPPPPPVLPPRFLTKPVQPAELLRLFS